jgi:hypothetical protein
MAESARKAYDAYTTMYEVGQATAEDLYLWSDRLMKAEQADDPASKEPAEAHWKRMRDLHKRIAALHQAGVAGGEESSLAAAEYYLAEAEAEYGAND